MFPQAPRSANRTALLPRSRGRCPVVRATAGATTRAILVLGNRVWPCLMGRSGRKAIKREGDGATPIGRWRLREVLYRADRGLPPQTRLKCRAIRTSDGWCDAVLDRNYNRLVQHPYPASAEQLWRDDHLYDVIVVLGYNDRPRTQGLGSAIFMHLAHPEKKPTAGCVALSRRDLRLVLRYLDRSSWLIVPS